MPLYAASKRRGGMSSIRTAGSPCASARAPSRAASRSASESAVQSQSTPPSAAAAASPDVSPEIIPPPPRLAVSDPSSPRWYETGPRFEATSSSRLGSFVIWNKGRGIDR